MKVYAMPDSNVRRIGRCPEGGILMLEDRPTLDHVAQADGTWVIDELKQWEKQMIESDKDMPRWAEDLWDVIGIEKAPSYVKDKFNDKKALRDAKP